MSKPRLMMLPGWTESDKHTRKMAAVAEEMGFEIAASQEPADVVITHSAGCYLVPPGSEAKLVMLINPSYDLKGSPFLRQFKDILLGAPAQIHQWGIGNFLKIRYWNISNIVLHFKRNMIEIVSYFKSDEIILPPAAKIVVVRNQGDRDLSAVADRIKKTHKQVNYVEIPGLHEDCWFNPEPYIDLLVKEL